MKRVMVSAFDERMAGYGIKMYRSFARFNPDVRMFYLDYGDGKSEAELDALGVTRLRADITLPAIKPNFRDMMLPPFLRGVEWDKLMWVDADTMVLRPLDPAWLPAVDFVGHPDRNDDGLELFCGYDSEHHKCVPGHRMTKYATGLWVTRSDDFLRDCWDRVKTGKRGQRDSDLATLVANELGYSHLQLDGNLWNFGRGAIALARYDGEHVYYKMNRRAYHPYTAGFSRVPRRGKDVRLSSPAIDKFYAERVEGATR